MVGLQEINGQDVETSEFLQNLDFVPDLAIDPAAWNPEVLNFLYLSAPMLVIHRRDSYSYLGSGRAYALAKELYAPNDQVPVLLVGTKRLDRRTKLQILVGEMFGLHASYRTRRHLPKRLYAIWNQLLAEDIPVIPGNGPLAFSHAIGCSIKSLYVTTESQELLDHAVESNIVDDMEELSGR